MKCALLGDPIHHSLSPVIHRAAYDELGLDWSYEPIVVNAGGLAAFVEGLDGSWRGLSLTMPLKREAVRFLDSQDEWSRLTGAANTIVFEDGRRHGLNTDVTGLLMVLDQRLGPDATLEGAVVLGGGATATSVLVALAQRGLRQAKLVVRDPARSADTLRAVSQLPEAPQVEVLTFEEALGTPLASDIVVSTVPVSAQVPQLVAALVEVPVVLDAVYEPWPTPLAAAAERTGRTVLTGLDLLVAQAVDQVRAMTGAAEPPVAVMRRAAQEKLDERSGR